MRTSDVSCETTLATTRMPSRRPTFDAKRAYDAGLVNEVVATGKQVEVALGMAEEIARCAPLVIRTIKRFVGELLPQTPSQQYARTLQQIDALRNSADFAEGTQAFREKRLD